MINEFRGTYYFLSNFYPSVFSLDNHQYNSVEAYFASNKTLDKNKSEMIAGLNNPKLARKLGKQVVLREDWDEIKDDIMYRGVKAKFEQNTILKEKLLNTYPHELVEKNDWGDKYWGVSNGQGENHLGKILMRVRDELRENIK